LVCDIIAAFPNAGWVAGKITQYGHGVCAQNGENCDCAPDEHVSAIAWERHSDTGTDSARFLAAGAKRSFWLRTKQGYLAEGLPLLRRALNEAAVGNSRRGGLAADVRSSARLGGQADAPLQMPPVIVESNSLLQFVKPSLYFAVVDPEKEDFKDSARAALDRSDAIVMRGAAMEPGRADPAWMRLPAKLLQEKPSVVQREGEPLPEPLEVLVRRVLEAPGTVRM
jgi:hypothetical protein